MKSPVFLDPPAIKEDMLAHIDLIGGRVKAAASLIGPDVAGIRTEYGGHAVEHAIERAPEAKEGETRRANRKDRRAMQSQNKKQARVMEKKKITHRQEAADTSEEGSIDKITFMQEAAANLHACVQANEKLRGRLHAHERIDVDDLMMSIQLGFMLGYIKAYAPPARMAQIEDVAAHWAKNNFHFRNKDGSKAKPKEESVIVQLPPMIIPG